MIQTFLTQTRNHRAISVLEEPNHEQKEILVIFCHGFVGQKIAPHRMFKELSIRLNKEGFTALRTDCIGSGDSEGGKEFMTIPGQVEDYTNVYQTWIRDKNYKKIFLLGYSMGGVTATLLSEKIPTDGLLLWSPVFDPYWNFYHILGANKFKQGLEGFDVDLEGDYIGKEFFEGIEKIDVIPTITNYEKPIEVIHGSCDNDVLPINGWSYAHFSKKGNLCLIDGADHTYADIRYKEALFDKTVRCLKNFIKEKNHDKYIE